MELTLSAAILGTMPLNALPLSRSSQSSAQIFRGVAFSLALIVLVVTTGALVAGALVPQTPRNDTPIVLDGEVWDVAQVGNAVVVAGNFTRVQTVRDGEIIDQAALFAFDIDSGALLTDFLPILTARTDVEVRDLVPAADGRSVYIGGKFTAIDDKTDGKVRLRNRIAKIDVTNGRLDRNFARGGVNAKVLSMDLHDGNLYVAGNFTTVYDTDIGRPPIDRAVNGLARFDATSGGFDTTFGFETRTAAGSIPRLEPGAGRTGGVAQIDVTPNGQYLAVAHRGMEIFDRNRNQVHRRPGLALIDLNANTVTGFQALYPDPADPVQDFYWAGQCRNDGIQIRDMEISPDGSYLVTVHQGTDAGYQCDTAVRWPITTNPTRPDWVSRLFDSVFSVEVDHDAIYVGGHMRHMVSPNAPSSYPGQTRPNGCCTGLPQMYDATFVLDAVHPNQRAFHSELKNPGLVYEIGQLGAINPATGKGIPSWNPGSDAWKGVLALELVDRGLLIGQDGPFGQESARINDINTGRAAFLDFDPDAGNPRCTAIVGDNGHVTINWTDIGNVAQWNIA